MTRADGTLADLVLVAHASIVLFIVGGFVLVWLGYFLKWRWVRNFYFRIAHLVAMGFVAAESVTGIICPLTEWENQLRLRAGADPAYEGGFIAHWVRRALFYELDDRVFTIVYVIFFALVALSFWLVRPRAPQWWRKFRPASQN